MSRSSGAQARSESRSEANSQTATVVRKKKWTRRLLAAGALAFIVGGALWAVMRVEGLPEGDSEARHETGPARRNGQRKPIQRLRQRAQGAGSGRAIFLRPILSAWLHRNGRILSSLLPSAVRRSGRGPTTPTRTASSARCLIVQGKLDPAIAALREATRLKPGRSEAHCKLGRALSAQGKLAEAVERAA